MKTSLLIINLWVDLLHYNTTHLSCSEESVQLGTNAWSPPVFDLLHQLGSGESTAQVCERVQGPQNQIKRHCACQLCRQVYVCFPVL